MNIFEAGGNFVGGSCKFKKSGRWCCSKSSFCSLPGGLNMCDNQMSKENLFQKGGKI